jgi:L-ascorbate metabolism protein UlaG (beta-lactamase superfamily)
MQEKKFYLKQNVIAEPLVNNWYAWSHLISPATFAMIVANRHLRIMHSYVNFSEFHRKAVMDPLLRGGLFLDIEGQDGVEKIKTLLEKTKLDCRKQLELAEATKELAIYLKNHSPENSSSFLSTYKRISETLKGYVELVYDINSNPCFKLFEALLYKSLYYSEKLQSVMLTMIEKDERPFVLSTPRFATKEAVTINEPFRSNFYDELFSARFKPKYLSELNELHEKYLKNNNKDIFMSFFIEQTEKEYISYKKVKSLQIKYFGHACILIQSGDINILIDPLISYFCPANSNVPRYTYTDLPEKIDYVVITHAHQDHFVLETLLQIRHKIENIIVPRNTPGALQDPSLALILKYTGFKNIIQMDELEEINILNGKIISVPFMGEHGDLNIQSKLAYIFSINNRTIFCAVDSNNIESRLYSHLRKIVPPIDVAFLGMECEGAPLSWLYGPLLPQPLLKDANESRRLNGSDCDRALDIIKQLNCKNVYIYAMGMEPWLSFISSINYGEESKPIIESNKLIAHCSNMGINAQRLFGKKDIVL